MSHAKALRLFLESNQPLALIFEDDNEIPVDPRETREKVDALARTTGWDFLNLSPCWSDCNCRDTKNKNNLNPATGLCANAYFVRRSAAKHWLQNMFPLSRDKYAHDLSIPDIPNALEVRPRLFWQMGPENTTGGNFSENLECRPPPFQWMWLCIVLVVLIVMVTVALVVRRRR